MQTLLSLCYADIVDGDKVSLLLGVHAHQPVGNFPEVLDDAHARCYRPFLHTLHRYPEFRFAVHFSGWLLRVPVHQYPEDMALLREMVERGQVEVFGGGDTEPVLAVIPTPRPHRSDHRAVRSAGAAHAPPAAGGLAHRAGVGGYAWCPALADAGIQYVAVDDYHFLCAGKSAEELAGYYTTEEDGRSLDLFPISEGLRYRIPFAPAHETVAFIDGKAEAIRRSAAIYFDDIEKFGIWPRDLRLGVREGDGCEQFIEACWPRRAIRTAALRRVSSAVADAWRRLSAHHFLHRDERVDAARRRARMPMPALVKQEKDHGRYERDKAFMRGGIWKNFLSRYTRGQLDAQAHAGAVGAA